MLSRPATRCWQRIICSTPSTTCASSWPIASSCSSLATCPTATASACASRCIGDEFGDDEGDDMLDEGFAPQHQPPPQPQHQAPRHSGGGYDANRNDRPYRRDQGASAAGQSGPGQGPRRPRPWRSGSADGGAAVAGRPPPQERHQEPWRPTRAAPRRAASHEPRRATPRGSGGERASRAGRRRRAASTRPVPAAARAARLPAPPGTPRRARESERGHTASAQGRAVARLTPGRLSVSPNSVARSTGRLPSSRRGGGEIGASI